MEELKLPPWLTENFQEPPPGGGHGRKGFLEKNLKSIASIRGCFFDSEERASKDGLLQALEPRARVMGVFIVVIAAAAAGKAAFLFSVLFLTVLLAMLSRVGIFSLAKKLLPAFIFTSVVTLPVFFNYFSPGTPVLGISVKGFRISITEEGITTGLFFITRVASMAALLGLLLLTTRERDFLGGLRAAIPSFFVTALYMTFRYIFILLKLAEEVTLARRSRTINKTKLKESRSWFAARVALFLDRSIHTAGELTLAMASRGFGGKVKVMAQNPLKGKDYFFLGFSFFVFFLSLGF